MMMYLMSHRVSLQSESIVAKATIYGIVQSCVISMAVKTMLGDGQLGQ